MLPLILRDNSPELTPEPELNKAVTLESVASAESAPSKRKE
jgi:hypothetical protein